MHRGAMVDIILAWLYETMASPMQGFENPIQKTVLPMILIILDDEVYRNAGDLVFASFDPQVIVGVDHIGDHVFLCLGETVGSGFFAEFSNRFPDGFNDGVMIPQCHGFRVGWLVDGMPV